MDNKKYNNTKLTINISGSIISFVVLLAYVYFGYSSKIYFVAQSFSQNKIISFLIYSAITGIILFISKLPLNFYSGYILEHKYKLSNQTISKWILEESKAILVGIIIGVPLLLFFYYSINTYTNFWWIPFAIGLLVFSVIIAHLFPIVILPIFYKLEKIDKPELLNELRSLTQGTKLNFDNLYKFDMSKNTVKANAALTGFGNSKKIILSDTLIDNFSGEEIKSVFAHEVGHYHHKHIIKQLLMAPVFSFLTFYFISTIYYNIIGYFGYDNINTISAYPLIIIAGMIVNLFITPIQNYLSRLFEYQADKYAVIKGNLKEPFISALWKLNNNNLGDENPHPFIEWYFYSHPSINKRIERIKKIK